MISTLQSEIPDFLRKTVRNHPVSHPMLVGSKLATSANRRKLLKNWLASLDGFGNWLIHAA
jgi:hypothetical protein